MCKTRAHKFLLVTGNLIEFMTFKILQTIGKCIIMILKKKKKSGNAVHTMPELSGAQYTEFFRLQSVPVFLNSHQSTDVSGLQT